MIIDMALRLPQHRRIGVDIRAVLDLLHGQLDRELTPPRIGCPKTDGVEGIPLGKPMAGVDNQPTEYLTRVFE